jgi:hypothetical protein
VTIRHSLCALALVPLGACASAGGQIAPPASSLQLRELQSRSYATDSMSLMKAVLGALQDEGFMVKTADARLGLITAAKESAQPASEGAKLGRKMAIVVTYGLAALLPGPKDTNSVLEATATISGADSESRLRINFQLKLVDGGSRVKEVRSVFEGRLYQEFFARVDKDLFLQREKVEPVVR